MAATDCLCKGYCTAWKQYWIFLFQVVDDGCSEMISDGSIDGKEVYLRTQFWRKDEHIQVLKTKKKKI